MKLSNLFFISMIGASTGCSVISDFSECDADSECQSAYGPSSVCNEGVCEAPQNVLRGPCANEDFPPFGPVDDPNTFVVGTVLALSGIDADFSRPILNSIQLAFEDFESLKVGGKEVGLIVCDSEGELAIAQEAKEILIEDARVPAIVGPDFSTHVADFASLATENGTLLMSPSATAASITKLQDDDLVWRTATSDIAQAEALVGVIENVVETRDDITAEDVSIWYISVEEDLYSGGLLEGIVGGVNPQLVDPSLVFAYPNGGWEEWYAETISGQPAPDIVVMLGFSESWDIVAQLERDYNDGTASYIMADAGRTNEKAEVAEANLEGRIFGTAPRTEGDLDYAPYRTFQVKYSSKFRQDPNNLQFVAHAYDAFYAVALAASAEGFTGPEIAKGLRRLNDPDGTSFIVSSNDISAAVSELQDGNDINLDGASGVLDFDENGEPPLSSAEISLWCFEKGAVPSKGVIVENGIFSPLNCMDAANQ